MENNKSLHYNIYKLSLIGFVAGFIATLTFHQFALWLMRLAAIAPFGPYNMTATAPFGIPAVFSLAFWGGIWGIIFVLMHNRFPRGGGYWGTAFVFGAVFPSLVALLVVLPLKGLPLGGGWHWQLLLTAFLINGVWGIGTAVLIRLMTTRKEWIGSRQPPECRPGMICP
jgi:hypothetical protein